MKKLLYILAFAILTTATITSCTEENDAKPSFEQFDNGGGGASDPK